ncbi:Isochorismatase domain-containing protein 2A [Psilocybe cubensis]|uniref:Isochorismatase domain-containing protein 2A n=2 Tax=Psilocybe cubensis TaxID=181762 RepID=A0ACB8H4H0_PSICU|nr:Isochorismatase domain-containing protein 2A [Psilocybe cubensis]KAH9482898.1 Isochorismatase domain-containing protein 2A [Psilocybe cubensis]
MLLPESTLFFLCDVQTKFKPAIHGYQHVVATAGKMITLATLLEIPVICTTQNAKALGPTDPAIDLQSLGPLLLGTFDKTLFSMVVPEVQDILASRQVSSIVIFGIESHVCVLQTVLSLLSLGKYTVYIVADGVSSCNSFEVPIALDRMRTEGAKIGTSESIAFQLMRDASSPKFKAFSKFIKEVKESTKVSGTALLQGRVSPSPSRDAEVASGGVVIKSAM